MIYLAIPIGFVTQYWELNENTIAGFDDRTARMLHMTGAIKICQDIVDYDSKITVDVIGCFSVSQPY